MDSLKDFFLRLNDYYLSGCTDPTVDEGGDNSCMYCGLQTFNKWYCSEACKRADTHENF